MHVVYWVSATNDALHLWIRHHHKWVVLLFFSQRVDPRSNTAIPTLLQILCKCTDIRVVWQQRLAECHIGARVFMLGRTYHVRSKQACRPGAQQAQCSVPYSFHQRSPQRNAHSQR